MESIEQLGAHTWRHIAPLARAVPASRLGGSLLLGMLWDLLPCGMVYSILLVAAPGANAATGAATMLCFGLGTVPAVLAAGLSSAQILRIAGGRRLSMLTGSMLRLFGVLTIAAPLGIFT